jgi:hypothetical protein
MRAREYFVGTILDNEYVLVEFVGEGSTAVVYAVAKVHTPTKRESVLKFYKPVPFLEMDVLHHSLRVDVEHYPNHPLLLTPTERLARLTDEMLGRISSARFEFRVALYQTLMHAAIQGIVILYSELHQRGELPPDFLESDKALRPRIDDNLLGQLKLLLEEDNINQEYVPFTEYLVEVIELNINKWRCCGTYYPFSSNPFYNLLGLWLERFINDEELDHIAAEPRLLKEASVETVEGLWWFATILYNRASDQLERIRGQADNASVQPRNESDAMERVEEEGRACVRACQLVAALAGSVASANKRLHGLADYWRGKALNLFPGNELDVLEAFESASAKLEAAGCVRDLHDLLIDLAFLLRESSPERSRKHIAEAKTIRVRLGIE